MEFKANYNKFIQNLNEANYSEQQMYEIIDLFFDSCTKSLNALNEYPK
jgi:hypothetical protein